MEIIVYGSGGHAKVVADVVASAGEHRIVAFIDDTRGEPGSLRGCPVYTSLTDPALAGVDAGLVAIGDNWARAQVVRKILGLSPGFRFVSAVHASAQIGSGVQIGAGAVLMPGVVVNADSVIGAHCILNTACSLDHDCLLGEFASLAPGVVVGGGVQIGARCAIGLGAQVIHRVRIGEGSIVGAGSLVTRSVPDQVVAYGSPCKTVRARTEGERYL